MPMPMPYAVYAYGLCLAACFGEITWSIGIEHDFAVDRTVFCCHALEKFNFVWIPLLLQKLYHA